jgi:apolipoprotein N-acyltransferase
MISGLIIDGLRTRASPLPVSSNLKPEAAGAVVLLAANLAYGLWRMNQTGVLSEGPHILSIQTNLPQDNKIGWPFEQQVQDFGAFVQQTITAFEQVHSAGHQVDLVVWPETMLPGFGLEPQAVEFLTTHDYQPRDFFVQGILDLHRRLARPLLIGSAAYVGLDVKDHKWVWRQTYNSAYLIDRAQPPFQRYDKMVLTPFGETMPYISNWPWLERQMIRLGVGADLSFDLDAGQQLRRLKLAAPDRQTPLVLATPICFEDTVAWYCRKMIGGAGETKADLFVNLSNDGWFSFSHADRKLHAQIARFRCIENRVPMVRSVNTGVSVVIDSAGRLVAATGGDGYGVAQRSDWVAAAVKLDSRHTLYCRIGDLWAWMCLMATAAGLGWTMLHRKARTTCAI